MFQKAKQTNFVHIRFPSNKYFRPDYYILEIGYSSFNPEKPGWSGLQVRVGWGHIFPPPHVKLLCKLFLTSFFYNPWNMYTIKVNLAWEHSSFKMWILWPSKVWYFPPKSSEGCTKLTPKNITLYQNSEKLFLS